jgi:hypothetical protein
MLFHTIACLVNFLVPYYVINFGGVGGSLHYYGTHRLGATLEGPTAEAVAQEIERTYGFQSIPAEIG